MVEGKAKENRKVIVRSSCFMDKSSSASMTSLFGCLIVSTTLLVSDHSSLFVFYYCSMVCLVNWILFFGLWCFVRLDLVAGLIEEIYARQLNFQLRTLHLWLIYWELLLKQNHLDMVVWNEKDGGRRA